MRHLDARGRLAFVALIATLASVDMYIAFALARQQPFPWATVAPYGALIILGLLVIPLVWWRHRAGFIGAIAFGVLNLLGDLFANAGVLPVQAAMQPTVPFVASTVAVSALIILYGVRAWREQVPSWKATAEPQLKQ